MLETNPSPSRARAHSLPLSFSHALSLSPPLPLSLSIPLAETLSWCVGCVWWWRRVGVRGGEVASVLWSISVCASGMRVHVSTCVAVSRVTVPMSVCEPCAWCVDRRMQPIPA